MLLEAGQECGWDWQVELVPDPDAVLKLADHVVASSDSQILDYAQRWFNLARPASRDNDANLFAAARFRHGVCSMLVGITRE